MKLSDILGTPRVEPSSIETFAMDVGRQLRVQRIAFIWRQSDLALRAGVSVRTIRKVESGAAISSTNLMRILMGLKQGRDFLEMLEAPNFPNLSALDRFTQLNSAKGPSLLSRSVRTKAPATSQVLQKKE